MKKKLYIAFLESPVGWLKLTSDSDSLLSIEFKHSKEVQNNKLPKILIIAQQQLTEYFNGKREEFQLTLKPDGTEFQQKIWRLVEKVPFGTFLSIGVLLSLLYGQNLIDWYFRFL